MTKRSLALAAALLCALPAAAEAATVQHAGSAVHFSAPAGERNDVTYLVEAGEFTVIDAGAKLKAGPGCRIVAAGKARCGFLPSSAVFELGDRDDVMTPRAGNPIVVRGGAGGDWINLGQILGRSQVSFAGGDGFDQATYFNSDRGVIASLDGHPNDGRVGDADNVDAELLHGGRFDDSLSGDENANTLVGSQGRDRIFGQGGIDTILEDSQPNGGDLLVGGSGDDIVVYAKRVAPVTVSLDETSNDGAAGEGDNVKRDVEMVQGGLAGDNLRGNELGNILFGGPGQDTISGALGNDVLFGEAGADTVGGGSGEDLLGLVDGEADIAACGSENDIVNNDPQDLVDPDCESTNGVGAFELAKRRGGLVLSWKHPADWKLLDTVSLRLEDRGKPVGTITLDQQSGKLRARGAIEVLRSKVTPSGKAVALDLRLRVAARHAGRPLTVKVAATDDAGTRQALQTAGKISL